jgi:hypothetical protein
LFPFPFCYEEHYYYDEDAGEEEEIEVEEEDEEESDDDEEAEIDYNVKMIWKEILPKTDIVGGYRRGMKRQLLDFAIKKFSRQRSFPNSIEIEAITKDYEKYRDKKFNSNKHEVVNSNIVTRAKIALFPPVCGRNSDEVGFLVEGRDVKTHRMEISPIPGRKRQFPSDDCYLSPML